MKELHVDGSNVGDIVAEPVENGGDVTINPGTPPREELTIVTAQEMMHSLAVTKGWWDGGGGAEHNIPEKLCLIHSEVSEALEVYRMNYGGINEPSYDDGSGEGSSERFPYGADGDTLDRSKPRKPIGFDSEMADIVIRVMDLCGYLGIDLEQAIYEKYEFNKTRPHRHGGKRC